MSGPAGANGGGFSEPISVAGALAAVLTTGVGLVAVLVPDLSQAAQIGIIAFGNSLILLGTIIFARARTTPTANPTLVAGTTVNVVTPEGQPNTVTTL